MIIGSDEKPIALWKRILSFNIFDILIYFLFIIYQLYKSANYIDKIFTYLGEKICYDFNQNKINNYFSHLEQNNYDLILYPKEKIKESNNIPNYTTPLNFLSKNVFFKSVIAYPHACFQDFDYTNLNEKEKNLIENLFKSISNAEKKIKDENSFTLSMAYLLKVLSFSNCAKLKIIEGIMYKIALMLIEKYWDEPSLQKQKDNYFEFLIKEFNKGNTNDGYFLILNDYVILIFRIKDEFKSFDKANKILFDKSQEILNYYKK